MEYVVLAVKAILLVIAFSLLLGILSGFMFRKNKWSIEYGKRVSKGKRFNWGAFAVTTLWSNIVVYILGVIVCFIAAIIFLLSKLG